MTGREWVETEGGVLRYRQGGVMAVAQPSARVGAGWFWWVLVDGRTLARGEADTAGDAMRTAEPLIAYALNPD